MDSGTRRIAQEAMDHLVTEEDWEIDKTRYNIPVRELMAMQMLEEGLATTEYKAAEVC